MARKDPHNDPYDDSRDDQDPRDDETTTPAGEAADEPARLTGDAAAEALDAEEPCVLPSLDDLESQGFTPDQVRRLVVVSDRAADSSESRAAEAELRRLRFTRWLIEHGVLDEWSA